MWTVLFLCVFVSRSFRFFFFVCEETKAFKDSLNLFHVCVCVSDVDSPEYTLYFLHFILLKPHETKTKIQTKQKMNEHDLNMQMQLKFRCFPNVVVIFALDGTTANRLYFMFGWCSVCFLICCYFAGLAVITFQGNMHFMLFEMVSYILYTERFTNKYQQQQKQLWKKEKKMIKQRFSVVHCTRESFRSIAAEAATVVTALNAMCQC